jgi:hypothetical protein
MNKTATVIVGRFSASRVIHLGLLLREKLPVADDDAFANLLAQLDATENCEADHGGENI